MTSEEAEDGESGRPSARADPVEGAEMANGEVAIPLDAGTDDSDAARDHAETIEGHTRPSTEPTNPAAPRPELGPSSRSANG